jgi:AraC-like DNA-binding protein
MDGISVITLLGVVQGFYLGLIVMLMRSPNRRANRFLGLLLMSYGVSILHFVFFRQGVYASVPDLISLSFPVLFLFGPLFYFYVVLLTDRTHPIRWKDLWHGVPFLLMFLPQMPMHFLALEAKRKIIADMGSSEYVHHGIFLGLVQIIHLTVYLIAVGRVLRAYDTRVLAERSSIEEINLQWVRGMIVMFTIVFGAILVLGVVYLLWFDTMGIYNVFVPCSVTVIIFTMGARGLTQHEIFLPMAFEEEKGEKYQRSALTPEKRTEYLGRLDGLMKSEKPHRDPELTLPGLAQKLAMPPYQVSQLLNEGVGKSFFDFVNQARVEEAKRLLIDPSFSAYTILAIATEAGFNSKTAFNAAFRKHAGMTPSAYRVTRPS